MAIIRATAAAVASMGIAVGLASPAWADERLDGDYTFTNGATVNTWTITTQWQRRGHLRRHGLKFHRHDQKPISLQRV